MTRPRSADELRRAFLDYFAGKGHRIVPSSSVIPHGDRTLLFTNAGMNQFKDVFLGSERREYTRASSVQKCIRAGGKHNDLDNVGYTARHLTFFEMLGNFSFGDYFKADAIQYAWELLTEGYGLDPHQLWITVYRNDEEARSIWKDRIGVTPGRIVGLGEKDNYWSMGEVGPCGPCSEILLDRGDRFSCGPSCGIGSCDCDRFFEIWNLVFMQFNQDADGKKTPLPRPSIDTGMGLERIAMVVQKVDSVYETDLLRDLIGRVERITGVAYDPGPSGVPHRVLADHVRSLVFAFADGAEPSNEGRGYVLRRILRRAARYGRKLCGSGQPILSRLAQDVVRAMGSSYTELQERAPYITRMIGAEEERFDRTLDEGIRRFEEVVEELKQGGKRAIPGKEVFFLYDTCGFPVDLVERMGEEVGFSVDLAGYEREMELQKKRSRKASKSEGEVPGEGIELLEYPETRFVGYERTREEAEILAVARRGEKLEILLSVTPFYADAGGQVGDAGVIRGEGILLQVENTYQEKGRLIHLSKLADGDPDQVRPGIRVSAEIEVPRRDAIRRNHTATHLLHAALRSVIGTHLHQKGSLVEPTRLRFDVTHFEAIRREELVEVEEIVLREITRDSPVEILEVDYGEAVKMGAMALFGEKYGDRVRVVKIGDFSLELCGGTHVRRTGEIGHFVVIGEGSVSAGVRRLEALTAEAALRHAQENARIISDLAGKLKCPPAALVERVEKLQELLASLKEADARSRKKAHRGVEQWEGLLPERIQAKGGEILLISGQLENAAMPELLSAYDHYKAKHKRIAAILLSTSEGKVHVLVAFTSPLSKAGCDARQVFQAGAEAIRARGGGRPEMVRGSGTQVEGIPAALRAMQIKVKEILPKSS